MEVCVSVWITENLTRYAKFGAYPMPRVKALRDTVGPATVMDLAKGY